MGLHPPISGEEIPNLLTRGEGSERLIDKRTEGLCFRGKERPRSEERRGGKECRGERTSRWGGREVIKQKEKSIKKQKKTHVWNIN